MSGEKPFKLELGANQRCLTATPEAQVAATLLPAMQAGAAVIVDEPLDPQFADNLSTIQDIYSTWYEHAERVTVQAPAGDPQPTETSNNKTAAFFTGGVDSFYTLLKHEEEVDTLVYVHGFDVDLDDVDLRQQVSDMLREVGNHFDKEVIEVETNLRKFSDGLAGWPQYHGAALAAVAHTLRGFKRFYIASTHPYDKLKPWGSSPLLDPLWRTCHKEIVHDGCEAGWLERCERVSKSGIALDTLRVCWKNRNGNYNCGECEKCIRTMVHLLAVGALDQCTRFEKTLKPIDISKNKREIRKKDYYYGEPLSALRKSGDAKKIQREIYKAITTPNERAYKVYKNMRNQVSNLFRKIGVRK